MPFLTQKAHPALAEYAEVCLALERLARQPRREAAFEARAIAESSCMRVSCRRTTSAADCGRTWVIADDQALALEVSIAQNPFFRHSEQLSSVWPGDSHASCAIVQSDAAMARRRPRIRLPSGSRACRALRCGRSGGVHKGSGGGITLAKQMGVRVDRGLWSTGER